MHNNGTSPLILPNKRLLPDLKPEAGVRLQATPQGVQMAVYSGGQETPILLPIQKAAELGVSLISVAALLANAGAQSMAQIVVPEPGPVPAE